MQSGVYLEQKAVASAFVPANWGPAQDKHNEYLSHFALL